MTARRVLAPVLRGSAWSDEQALEVLRRVEREGDTDTALNVLTEYARLERAAQELRATLERQRQDGELLEDASDTRALLEDAEQRLEMHQALYYEYAPLFPYVLDSAADE